MKRSLLSSLFFLSVTAGPVAAEETFRWRGEVDGVDEIQIRGESVRINHLRAQPIQNHDFRFTEPLPRRDVQLRLERIAGRGDVRIVEEPNAWNQYTATVRIDDGGEPGSDYYEFAVSWPSDDWEDDWENEDWDRSPEWSDDWNDSQREGFFRWSGRVDKGAEISIRGDSHNIQDQGGSGTQEMAARFSTPLPRTDVPVSLHKLEGRGRVELLQTPSARNNYVARVRITDDDSGADDYEFELRWRR
jgi:hypothetical protein